MIALVLLLLTAVPERQVAIVERSTLGVSPAVGGQLRERLKKALEAVELEAVISKDGCADRPCLMAMAKERDAVVVGMTVVKNRRGLTVDLEAVDGEVVVLQQTFLLSSEKLERSPEAQVFAHQLAARVVKKDAPVVEPPPVVVPAREVPVVETRPEWLEPAPAPIAPKVVGITSAGVGLVGVGLLIAGAVAKGNLDRALGEVPVVTTLSREGAQQQADLANGLLGGGSVALGLGLAGGVTALVMGLSAD